MPMVWGRYPMSILNLDSESITVILIATIGILTTAIIHLTYKLAQLIYVYNRDKAELEKIKRIMQAKQGGQYLSPLTIATAINPEERFIELKSNIQSDKISITILATLDILFIILLLMIVIKIIN